VIGPRIVPVSTWTAIVFSLIMFIFIIILT
jgi:hypothetical protein